VILDTSAVVAIMRGEPEAERFAKLLAAADQCRISVANYLELSMVLERQAGSDANRRCEALFKTTGIILEPVTLDQGMLARQAHFDYGKGRHPAALNFGDCFAYALSKALREPLLFKGDDFSKTDVNRAA
jgi:ribonuclease VapC